VNVFWGANGSGKTSMLKILHRALANDATALLRVPFTRAVVEFISDNEREYIRSISRSELTSKEGSQLTLDFESAAEEVYWRHQIRDRASIPTWHTEPDGWTRTR
jgi:predicted ATP-dependent endonuclease of OLD family